MPTPYIEALKDFNRGKPSWCIPRKGTSDYMFIRKMMDRTGPGAVAERNKERDAKATEQLKALDTRPKIDERREEGKKTEVRKERQEKAMEQLKALDTTEKITKARKADAQKALVKGSLLDTSISARGRVLGSKDLMGVVNKFLGTAKQQSDSTFKNIFLTFLKNVENGERADYENKVLKNDEDGEKYHSWESTKSYPIFSPKMLRPFVEVEADYDPSKPNTSRKSQYRIELGFETPQLASTWMTDAPPLTPVRVLIVGFDKKIGKMSMKDALRETIKVLERTPVSLKNQTAVMGKNYTKAAIVSYFDKELKETYPEVYDTGKDDDTRLRYLTQTLDTPAKLLAYLKHKKVKGVSVKTTTSTLKEKLVLPTPDDVEFLAKLGDEGRPQRTPLSPAHIKSALARQGIA